MPECWKMPVFISVHHRAERHLTDFLVRLVFIKNKRLRSRLMAGPVLLPGRVLISIIARLVRVLISIISQLVRQSPAQEPLL